MTKCKATIEFTTENWSRASHMFNLMLIFIDEQGGTRHSNNLEELERNVEK